MTEPAVTEPAVTEPAVAEPAVTEPAVTEPAMTEPAKSVPSWRNFVEGADAWLAALYPRVDETGERRFVWGREAMRSGCSPSLSRTRASALPAIRQWRQELSEHGYGWISGPTEFGGAGLPPALLRAFERLTRA